MIVDPTTEEIVASLTSENLLTLAGKYDGLAGDTRKSVANRIEASVISTCLTMVAESMAVKAAEEEQQTITH